VLFTAKGDWAQRIREFIDPARFQAVFHNFDDPALALNRFDIIVPLELLDYEALRRRHRGGTNYLMPDEKTIALAHDKIRFNDFLMANGFGRFVPQIYNGEVAYPFVYKKRQGSWGLDADIIHTPQEKEAFEAQTGTSVYFKQEYVGGRIEYVTHAFAVKGGRVISSPMNTVSTMIISSRARKPITSRTAKSRRRSWMFSRRS